MAELNQAVPRKKGGRKQLSTRVDLTPMVDLGFLLITFFIFTTTMASPRSLELAMPYAPPGEDVPRSAVKEGTVLTLIPAAGHKVYYYEGMPFKNGQPAPVGVAGFSSTSSIRDVIIHKKEQVRIMIRQGSLLTKDKTTVLIKPEDASCYDDFVRVLDEMQINGIDVYAVMPLDAADRQLLQQIH